MLSKTYDKIIDLFHSHHGYMSFEQLRDFGITVLQMRELEEEGVLERFTRGWYWCNNCGYTKPADYKYIEIAKMNPDAVFCLDSACFLAGLDVIEPEVIKVATAREDRRKMDIVHPIKRYYLTHIEVGRYIKVTKSEFGSYRYFSPDRALYDCLNAPAKVDSKNGRKIQTLSVRYKERINRYGSFLKKLKSQEKQERKRSAEE